MNIKTLFFILLTFLLLSPIVKAEAENVIENNTSSEQIQAKKLDNRAVILTKYLAKYNSPLQYHAQDFIDAAKTYDLDWKMVVSIAGVESTFGKHIPGGYNGWGWGVYGTQAIYFESWKDGIYTVSKGLREGYLNKGLTDPYSINRVYAASPTWGKNVTYFMNDLEKFAKEFEAQNLEPAKIESNIKIAAVSGQLDKE